MLREVGKQAMLDFLNEVNNDHLSLLEDYFDERVVVEKLNYDIVENVKLPLSEAGMVCDHLCRIEGFNYFSTWRDESYLYISFWR